MTSKLRFLLILALIFATCSIASVAQTENPIPVKISNVITSYLINKDPKLFGKKIEITYKYADRTFKELKYRTGNISFEVAELYPDFKPLGNVIVPIQVIVDGAEKEKLFLRTKISVYDKIVVAKKKLKRGDPLDEDSVGLDDRDIAALSSGVISDISSVLGKESKTLIPQGNAVYEWMVKEKSFVKKFDKVKIIAGGQGISVTVQGQALEDGAMGQIIKIKNLSSGKELTAVVTGTEEVTIK